MTEAVHMARLFTEDEWIALEEELETRFEYLDGHLYDVWAMAGGTIPHSRACANVSRHLGNAVGAKGKGCFTYNSEVKVQVREHRRYYYPDASVRCGEEEPGNKTGSYRNPTVIVEVVSESSYHRDTVTKFAHYPTLPSLRDYVLVFLREPAVQVYSRSGPTEKMAATSYFGLDDRVRLPSLDVYVAMSELYDEVPFPPEAKVVDHPNRDRDDDGAAY